MSRRAALRAGTALGTAAIAGAGAGVAEAQMPGGGGAQSAPPEEAFQDDNIGETIEIPGNPVFVRGRSLEQLLRDQGVGNPDPALGHSARDNELIDRVRRLEAKEVNGRRGVQNQLIVNTLAAIVAQTGGPIRVQFQIRKYIGRRPQPPTPDDIVSIGLGPVARGQTLKDASFFRVYFS